MSTKPTDDLAREAYRRKDGEHWEELQKIVAEGGLALSEVLINYPAFVRRRELTRVLADYDLFRMVVDLPGSIVELGVYLGAGLFTWSKLLETFVPGDRSRKVYGFESGGGYQDFAPEDGDPAPWIENVVGRKVPPPNFLEQMVKLTNHDNLVAGVERCRVVPGDILETVPRFARENQGTRLCLVFLDVNLYKPTLTGLRELYPLLVPGGIVALNGFGSPPWRGEAEALERYFREIGLPAPHLRKLPYSVRPGGYFVKE
jgi:Macrocin-O-methyltransferase (TylF)